MKNICILLAIALFLVSCKRSTLRTPDEAKFKSNVQNYLQRFEPPQPLVYKATWKQPANIRQKCEILFENWQVPGTPEANDDWSIFWDGQCSNGKADGLGKITSTYGSLDTHEICHLFDGVSEQYFYTYIPAQKRATYGRYVRQGGKSVSRQVNIANTDDDGKITSVFFSGSEHHKIGKSEGAFFKYYTDGSARFSGVFANGYFFGQRDGYDQNSILTTKIFGIINLNTDALDGYVVWQNVQQNQVAHVLYNNNTIVQK